VSAELGWVEPIERAALTIELAESVTVLWILLGDVGEKPLPRDQVDLHPLGIEDTIEVLVAPSDMSWVELALEDSNLH
jgi:hypothetical protein